MNKVTEQLAIYLLEDEFFAKFKLRKSDSTIINKQPTGYEKVELQNWIDTNAFSGKTEVVILPVYLKRFTVLHKWFEKFSFKTISDQRDAYSIGFEGLMLGNKNEYRFSISESVSAEWEAFRSDVAANAKYVFNKFTSLADLYDYLVFPVITGEKPLPDVGADWIFEYLLLTRTVDEKNYERVKQLILDRVEEMNSRGEPNIERYYNDLRTILAYLKNDVTL
ncbi:MAG: hypothetical protein ACLGGY_04450 [Gammaproteobacteria bacterium]